MKKILPAIVWQWCLVFLAMVIFGGQAFPQADGAPYSSMEESPDELFTEEGTQNPMIDMEEIADLGGAVSEEELELMKSQAAKQPIPQNETGEPRILPSGESKSAVTPQALSLPSGEASITGMGESFQPLLTTGAASMSIPVALPPGRAGVQPSLAFSYLSTAGNGPVGIGWLVSVPFIARQTDKGMPRYETGSLDRFIYNGGEEIVPVATPAETADCRMAIDFEIPYYDPSTGSITNEAVEKFPEEVCGYWYFRTRLEGAFLRFFWNGGERWIVQDKNGTIMTFEPGVVVDGGTKIFQWNLTKIRDVHGNTVHYQYDRDGGFSYLRHIWYNSPVMGEEQDPREECGTPGDFSCYGHHVDLQYEERPDPILSYGSGFRVETRWRLVRVTVESRDLYMGGWVHTRDYDISYDDASYWSIVSSIQLWGRNRADSLPAMVFSYTEVSARTVDGGADAEIPGFGGIDGTLKEFAWSPPHGVDEGMTDLFDANHDGFADVLVTDMARYDHGHGLFINICDSSGTCSFTETDYPVKLWGNVPVGADFDLANTNLNPLDIDSDGVVEFLHMPHLRDYEYFRIFQEPEGEGMDSLYSGYSWVQEGPFPPSGVDPDLDFTRDAAEIRLLDLDNDHMVDVLRTTGTRMEHWLNLGRCEGGEGKFGTPSYNEYGVCTGWTIEPITSCVLYRGLPKKFSDGDLRLADMNGDGMQDIVHLRQGDVAFWAGRGPGKWGDDGACQAGTYGDDRETVMTGSYMEMRPDVHQVFLSDVNGDGLSDLLQVRFDAVDIWINVGGYEFMPRHIIDRTPAHPGFTDRVRFADVDGTGTPDLLWGDAGRYRYIDFSGGIRPRLLTIVDNGLGKMTSIDYQPSTADYVRDMENGKTPESVSPLPSMVVSRVTVSDSLGWEKITEYYYHDGFYDGCEAEFRGYQEAEVRELGDENSPTSWTRSRFHVGARPSGTRCLDDNPYEGLKGQPAWTEIRDDTGIYKDTEWSSYIVEKLYEGLDDRDVHHAYSSIKGSFLYDTASPGSFSDGPCAHRTAFTFRSGETEVTNPQCVPVRSSTHEEVLSESLTDKMGNTLTVSEHGIERSAGDETIRQTRPCVIETWLHRTSQSWVEGNSANSDLYANLDWHKFGYNGRGDLTGEWVYMAYPGPEVLPPPSSGWAVTDGTWSMISYKDYMESGLVSSQWNGIHLNDGLFTYKRHMIWTYEASYGFHLASEAVEVRPGEYLTSSYGWDGGLSAIVSFTDYNGEQTRVTYDPLGRVERMYLPGCLEPSAEFEYDIGAPLSWVRSVHNETCQEGVEDEIQEPDSEASIQGYVQYGFFDGFGRLRGTVKEGDGVHPWVVQEHIFFDARGNKKGVHAPYALSSPLGFNVSPVNRSLVARTTYDAFGRSLCSYAVDGEDFQCVTYGLLREDEFSRAALTPGPYFGSYSTRLFDGRGRMTKKIVRLNRDDGDIELLATKFTYNSLDAVVRVARGKLSGNEESDFLGMAVEKKMIHDASGMRIAQIDPDRGTMYLIVDEIGSLVRWQDGRGMTIAFYYDLATRLTAEDYGYNATLDVIYGYDQPFSADWYNADIACHSFNPAAPCPRPQRNLLGRLSWVMDRAGTRIWSYTPRDQVEWLDVQFSSYERDSATGEWEKRDDFSQIWHSETRYDMLDRVVSEDYPQEGSRVLYHYSSRGLIESVELHRPLLLEPQPVIAHVAYNEAGQPTRIDYADEAQTSTRYSYDIRQRLVLILAGQESFVPDEGSSPVARTLLDYTYWYDVGGNLSAKLDNRDASQVTGWSPVPVNYYYGYDSLHRLISARPVYQEPQPDRVGMQHWRFDRLGSATSWSDEAHGFYQWSLGNIRNGLQLMEEEGATSTAENPIAPHAIYKAYDVDPDAPEEQQGSFLAARYDDGGNMTSLEVYRQCGACSPETYTCAFPCGRAEKQSFLWDEMGRLQEVATWPGVWNEAEQEYHFDTASNRVQFTYNCSNERMVKKAVDQEAVHEQYSLYPSRGFEIRESQFSQEEGFWGGQSIQYLHLMGSKVARIVEDGREIPGRTRYVFFYLQDNLGSTSMVVDGENGMVVLGRRDLAYGQEDARVAGAPEYEQFKEYYTFTGKEGDEESGLVHFGERYYAPRLGRWISPDPLGPFADVDPNSYRYCGANPVLKIDPDGQMEPEELEWYSGAQDFSKDHGAQYTSDSTSTHEAHWQKKVGNKIVAAVEYPVLGKGKGKCWVYAWDLLYQLGYNVPVKPIEGKPMKSRYYEPKELIEFTNSLRSAGKKYGEFGAASTNKATMILLTDLKLSGGALNQLSKKYGLLMVFQGYNSEGKVQAGAFHAAVLGGFHADEHGVVGGPTYKPLPTVEPGGIEYETTVTGLQNAFAWSTWVEGGGKLHKHWTMTGEEDIGGEGTRGEIFMLLKEGQDLHQAIHDIHQAKFSAPSEAPAGE